MRARTEVVQGSYYFFVGQVLSPKSEYNGQVPMSPVTSGRTPMYPHAPRPLTAIPMSTSPTTTRSPRSTVPSLRAKNELAMVRSQSEDPC